MNPYDLILTSRIELETFKGNVKSEYYPRYIARNKRNLPVGSSKTAHREDTLEANGHGDGEGLLHRLRDDRLASPRSHHLDRGERDVQEWQGR